MPFGLAPRLATKMVAPVIRYLRSRGLRLAIYIDDLILLSQSYKESIEHTTVGGYTTQARLRHSSREVPSNPLPIGGVSGHTVPRDKIRSTRRESRAVFSENENNTLTVRKFCSLLGKLNSLSGAVISAQLHLCRFII